jgi:hypothetical protein
MVKCIKLTNKNNNIMSKKEFSKFEIAAIKRTAQNCAGMIAKFDKLSEKIAILQAEKESIEKQIAHWDAPIVEMTGHHVMDLVERERVKTGKDKDGNDIYGSKWVLKYPETVIPVEGSDTDVDTTPDTKPEEEVVEEQPKEDNELDDEDIKF